MIAPSSAGRRLASAVAVLFGLDLMGGALAIAGKVNTPADAWGSRAVLAAPLPMIGAQAALAAASLRWNGARGSVAAGLLALACLVSGLSGFFDGQLGKRGLPARLVAFQLVLVAWTVGVGVLAALRAVESARPTGRG